MQMDKREYESIYTEYRRKVLGFVRSKVANPADADDIVQTVFLKVYSRLEKYDERKASLSTWIYTVTRNTVYDYLREKRNRPTSDLPELTVVSEEETYESVMRRETLEELACALEKLPQEQRDAVILLYYKGLDRQTVAEMFGISYGRLRYLHDKALKRLGELLHIAK